MNHKFISVVIAAFNEEGNVKELTERIVATLKDKYNYEIIYSIAGTDNTINILKELQKKNKNIKIYYSEKPNGLGNDFKKGFNMISKKSDYVVTMDADLNHQPEEIPKLLSAAKNYSVVIGSRNVKGGIKENIPFWKQKISDFANITCTAISGIKIKDKTSGFRIYKTKIIRNISKKYICKNFEFLFEILLIAKKKRYSMVEVPITFKYRVAGQSKFRLLNTALNYFKLFMRGIN